MRLVGTALTCVLAAFGAAFLVTRTSGHESPGLPVTSSSVRPAAETVSTPPGVDVKLAQQFAPRSIALQRRNPVKRHRVHRRHHASAPVSMPATSAPPVTPTAPQVTTTPASQDTMPASQATASSPPPTTTAAPYTPRTVSPAPAPSGQGSGTTSIGGGSSRKHRSGSGSTSVG